MNFFRSLCLAIIATAFLTYALGATFMSLLDINISVHNSVVEPLQAISISALITVILVLAATAIILSVFGGIIFIVLMVLASIALAFIGVFWPVILAALLITYIARSNKRAVSA